jgi:lysozyme
MAITGIDLYSGTGKVNWSQIKDSGNQFAYIRAAYGDQLDTAALGNYKAAKAAGLTCGFYQFLRQTRDIYQQIAIMLRALGLAGYGRGDLPPALDVEDNPAYDGNWNTANNAGYVDSLRRWVRLITAKTGKPPVIYTRTEFWNNGIGSPPGFGQCPLWIARYYSRGKGSGSLPQTKGPGNLPLGWKTYSLWQYSDRGSFTGSSSRFDLNLFNGTGQELAALTL